MFTVTKRPPLNIFAGSFKARNEMNTNKRVRGKPCPWLTSDLKSKMTTRDKILRKMRKTKLQFDINAYKAKRNEVNIALRKAKSQHFKNLLSENTNSPKKILENPEVDISYQK